MECLDPNWLCFLALFGFVPRVLFISHNLLALFLQQSFFSIPAACSGMVAVWQPRTVPYCAWAFSCLTKTLWLCAGAQRFTTWALPRQVFLETGSGADRNGKVCASPGGDVGLPVLALGRMRFGFRQKLLVSLFQLFVNILRGFESFAWRGTTTVPARMQNVPH
jgi:hypothetical protein